MAVSMRKVIGSLKGPYAKTRRQRQRERHQTKALMSRIAMYVRYNSWYISLPSSAEQKREMAKLCVVWRT